MPQYVGFLFYILQQFYGCYTFNPDEGVEAHQYLTCSGTLLINRRVPEHSVSPLSLPRYSVTLPLSPYLGDCVSLSNADLAGPLHKLQAAGLLLPWLLSFKG